MALTKPKLSQNIDTDISVFTDPILVLHQGSTLANVDTGFLFNRANGLVSNVAIYWSESANSFVTAFTTSTGAPDANVAPTQFANIRLGTATANIFQSDDYRYSNGAAFVSTTLANTAEITANLSSGQNVGLSLTTTGVAAGNYGSATSIPTIVVDSKGRITSLTANAVSTTINLAGTSGSGSVAGGGTLTVNGTANQLATTVSSSTITVAFTQDITAPGNLTVTGNLVVQGNTVTLNTETLTVEDKLITIANGSATASAADGAGINVAGANANLTYVNATDTWNTTKGIVVPGANVTTTGSSGALNVTYTPTASSGAAIQTIGKDSQGGIGYFDFLKATNTTAGATNANKSFRLSSDGTIEIVNSAYSQIILSITDAGVLKINNTYQFPTVDGTSGQALITNGAGLLTFANVSGGGGSGATGFPQSTVTTFPTGDYGSGEAGGVNTGSPTTDAFEVPLGTLFDTHEPRGSSTTVDLNA